jgi:hypothetical protein
MKQLDATTFSDALWKSIYDRQYERVAAIHQDLPLAPTFSELSVSANVKLAAMAANGSIGNLPEVLRIFESLRRQDGESEANKPVVATERLLYVLIHSCCVAEELKTAEALLYTWVDRVIKHRPRYPQSASSTPANSAIPPPPPTPPLNVLRGLLKDWKKFSTLSLSSSSSSEQNTVSSELDQLLGERVLLDLEEDLDWSRIGLAPIPLHVFATMLRAYASAASHSEDGPLWRRCLLLLDILEKERIQIPAQHQQPQDSVANKAVLLDVLVSRSHFLESLSDSALWSILYHQTLQAVCQANHGDQDLAVHLLQRMREHGVEVEIVATLSLLKTYHSGALTLDSDATAADHRFKQEHLIAIYPKILNTVLSLMKTNLVSGDGYHAAKMLTKEYLHVLCKLGRVDLADAFLSELGRHELTRKFTSFPQLVQPLVHGYSKQVDGEGSADRCLELFAKVAHRHHEQPLLYHSVCEALHRARDFDKLAEFVDRYGKLAVPLSEGAEGRKQSFKTLFQNEQELAKQMDYDLVRFLKKHGQNQVQGSPNNKGSSDSSSMGSGSNKKVRTVKINNTASKR